MLFAFKIIEFLFKRYGKDCGIRFKVNKIWLLLFGIFEVSEQRGTVKLFGSFVKNF